MMFNEQVYRDFDLESSTNGIIMEEPMRRQLSGESGTSSGGGSQQISGKVVYLRTKEYIPYDGAQ